MSCAPINAHLVFKKLVKRVAICHARVFVFVRQQPPTGYADVILAVYLRRLARQDTRIVFGGCNIREVSHTAPIDAEVHSDIVEEALVDVCATLIDTCICAIVHHQRTGLVTARCVADAKIVNWPLGRARIYAYG